MSKYIIGYDIGKAGGIVVLKGSKVVFKCAMPMIGKELPDARKIASILNHFNKKGSTHVVIEKFGGFFGYGKKTAVSVALQRGIILAACKIIGVAETSYMPTQWQKVMFEGTTVIYKKVKGTKKKDTKKMALVTVNRLLPKENWLATKRSSVPHDGMIDAALLALFGERKNL